MALNLTDLEERRLLDLSLPDDAVYLALFTTAPDEAGAGGVEVAGGAYARQPISMAAAATVAGATSKTNDAAVTYPQATAAQGTILAYGVLDAPVGGNLRWVRPLILAEQRTIALGDQYVVPAGALSWSLD